MPPKLLKNYQQRRMTYFLETPYSRGRQQPTEPMDGDQFTRVVDAMFSDEDHETISATGSGEPETSA
jgi:hypothetical protein